MVQETIVMDLGVLLIKIGFGGECVPRRVFPAVSGSHTEFVNQDWTPLYTWHSHIDTLVLNRQLQNVLSALFEYAAAHSSQKQNSIHQSIWQEDHCVRECAMASRTLGCAHSITHECLCRM